MTMPHPPAYLRSPKLRPLNVQPHLHNGQEFYLLRDPLALANQSLLIPKPLAPILALCDGTQADSQAISHTLRLHYRLASTPADIERLLSALDEALLLENPRSDQARQAALERYRQAPFRSPTLTGSAYPADRRELQQLLKSYLAGVTLPPAANGHIPVNLGLFSPHIDYRRGGAVYAHVWQRARELAEPADLVLLFATDHFGGSERFTLTRQQYATPYGPLPTDLVLVDALAALLGPEVAYAGELRHCNEHSVELVAVWLHHMRDGRPCTLLPILTGSLYDQGEPNAEPAADPTVERLLETLAGALQGRRVLVVASGDMAHVGPAFGGAPVGAAERVALRAADAQLLQHLGAGDAAGFYAAIRRVQDRNNVCGVSPFYLSLRLMERLHGAKVHGELSGYAQCAADPENRSLVSICGLVY